MRVDILKCSKMPHILLADLKWKFLTKHLVFYSSHRSSWSLFIDFFNDTPFSMMELFKLLVNYLPFFTKHIIHSIDSLLLYLNGVINHSSDLTICFDSTVLTSEDCKMIYRISCSLTTNVPEISLKTIS